MITSAEFLTNQNEAKLKLEIEDSSFSLLFCTGYTLTLMSLSWGSWNRLTANWVARLKKKFGNLSYIYTNKILCGKIFAQ